MLEKENSGILAIGAHPDDIELGCGASLAKLASKGKIIYAIVLTKGTAGFCGEYDRIDETNNSLSYLGVKKVYSFDFDDTQLNKDIEQVILTIEQIIYALNYQGIEIQRVYTMTKDDRHQDHRTVYDASIVACRYINQILCYETPSSRLSFSPKIFEKIDEVFLEKKIESIRYHQSQQHRTYMQPEQIRALAIFRGQQSGFLFSEAFTAYKLVL